jgi:quercetin dioxygenase-like cupin family protein/ketosteroid isomerase-like protein
MTAGARTPEELDGLLEDAFVLRDDDAFGVLFDAAAVLVETGGTQARGGAAIARALADLRTRDRTYVACPRRVLRAGDMALVVSDRAVHVARRGGDGSWRAAISLVTLEPDDTNGGPMSQDTQLLPPMTTRDGEGEALWWFNCLAEIKVTAEDTGGLMSIIEITEPPNAEAPLHVHQREDEGFWILDGSATFEVGDATIEAHAGDYAFGPRGIPHRYTVGPDGCRMLFIMTPGGFENLVREMSVPAESRTLPPPPPEDFEPDWEHIAAVATANGCELLV